MSERRGLFHPHSPSLISISYWISSSLIWSPINNNKGKGPDGRDKGILEIAFLVLSCHPPFPFIDRYSIGKENGKEEVGERDKG